MLHFRSTSTSAHVAKKNDIDRLHELLGNEVWAFSNCRVEVPGRPIAEIDWLFYNTNHGTLMVSEWKRYPRRVVEAKDTGAEWRLGDGSLEPNPVEQVARQQDVLRWAIRDKVLPRFFPDQDGHRIRVMQSVYCPQIDKDTIRERLRFGKLYSNIDDLCSAVNMLTNPLPLLAGDMTAVRELAGALAELFRCQVPDNLEEAIGWQHNPKESARFWQETCRIHTEIGALHQQLAQLIHDEYAPRPRQTKPPETTTEAVEVNPAKPEVIKLHELIGHYVSAHLAGLDGKPDLIVDGIGEALRSILTHIPHRTWVTFAAFGGAVCSHLESPTKLSKLLGAPVWEWSLETARKHGLKVELSENHQSIRIVA